MPTIASKELKRKNYKELTDKTIRRKRKPRREAIEERNEN